MVLTASLTVFSLAASLVLTLAGWGSPLAAMHLAFAVGIVPLIFGAMIHFVPVLTRTGDPDRPIRFLPSLAQASGLVAVLAMQGWVPYGLLYGVAAVDGIFALILMFWIFRRARRTLGSPHPGWRWYAASLACLLAAMAAVQGMMFWPEYRLAWRLFHLHINTLGLVGLAALGTLPVLLPTALGQPDPEAAGWLKRRLLPAASGVAMVAIGAASIWSFSIPGSALMLVVAIGLIAQWGRRFRFPRLLKDGVATSLLCAALGFSVLLASGVLHAAGLIPARPAIAAWAVGFLLPLVTGALSQLLPVWRWPGPITPARVAMREKLSSTGQLRAGLFVLAALALLGGLAVSGAVLGAAGMALFVIALLQSVRIPRSTR